MNGFALSSGNEDRRFGAHHRELIDQSRHPDDKTKALESVKERAR